MPAFPTACPNCRAYTATNATAHCPVEHCPWLRCKLCNFVFPPHGRGKFRKDLVWTTF